MTNVRAYIPVAALAGILLGLLLLYGLSRHPDANSSHGYAVVVLSEDCKELADFYRERRYFLPRDRIPDHVKNAFIAIEDRRFYSHHGFDPRGILRALHKNFGAHAIREGGSTITQQLAKAVLMRPERSISRKLREMFVTAQLEWNYTKDEIIGMYLNLAYFGERIYGIESAARTYFNKSTEELSVAEAALLAALQKAPNRYSPVRYPERARARRGIVLDEMLLGDFISPDEYRTALAEPIPKQTFFQRKYSAPYFVEFLRQLLARKYGNAVYTGGYRIHSTIDPAMQALAEKAVGKGVRKIEGRTGKGVQAALVALDLANGEIRAMVGGADFRMTQFNRATMALRQPGSAFKPFVYAAALERGMSYNDQILDLPVKIPDPDTGDIWSPKNTHWEYHGYVTLKTAMSLSLNAATVRLAQDVGIDRIRELASRSGIRARLASRPSLALGSSEVTLLDLTASYVALATGKRITPTPYTLITDKENAVVEKVKPSSREVLSGDVVNKMKVLLRSVVESGTGGKALAVNRVVYGKTGTTDDYSDAWFVGFDDRIAVGVWVGRDDHTPLGFEESGSESALPIWVEFMRNVKYR